MNWDSIMTPAKEDAIRQWSLDRYTFNKGIKTVEADDGFIEVYGMKGGPIYLSATFVREIK